MRSAVAGGASPLGVALASPPTRRAPRRSAPPGGRWPSERWRAGRRRRTSPSSARSTRAGCSAGRGGARADGRAHHRSPTCSCARSQHRCARHPALNRSWSEERSRRACVDRRRARGCARRRARRPRDPRRRYARPGRARGPARGLVRARARWPARAGRCQGGDVHDQQPRHVWRRRVHRDHQSAASRDPRRRAHRRSRAAARWPAGRETGADTDALLRPPRRRRRPRRLVPATPWPRRSRSRQRS